MNRPTFVFKCLNIFILLFSLLEKKLYFYYYSNENHHLMTIKKNLKVHIWTRYSNEHLGV